MQTAHSSQGFSLIELIIALAIFITVVSGVTYLAVTSPTTPFEGSGDVREQARFAQEALGAIDVIKDRSWSTIETYDDGSSVQVQKDGSGNWTIVSGTEVRGAFTRDIKITTVQRDTSDVIVTSGGSDDPSTKKVSITISATGKANYVVETYITNWESYGMSQTDWGGSSGSDTWTAGTTNYGTSSNMDLPTTSGKLRLKMSD